MMTRDIFRLVSLRQAKPAAAEDGTIPEPTVRFDPRRDRAGSVEGPEVERASSREARLQDLKRRHAASTKRIRDLEFVQLQVMKAAMQAEQMNDVGNDATPAASATDSSAVFSRAVATRANNARGSDAASTTMARVHERMMSRLTPPHAVIYRDAVAGHAGAVDLNDVFLGLDAEAEIITANQLCAEIRGIEQSTSDPLPVVEPVRTENPFIVAAGYGELIVAQETLVGYVAREIAHIENVMPGESKVRKHSRLSKTEEVVETETITEKESEKDLQTTDRYELQAEAQETINRDFAVRAGVNMSGSYGLTQVDTSLDTAFSQSTSQSRSNSLETAREIVSKSVERTFERVRKLRRLTVTEEIRELNRHELANLTGSQPPQSISGMYLWVEKIQQVQLRHYGTRLMLEFHIPEPAMSLLARTGEARTRRRLPPFDVSPSDIQPGNYMCLAKTYGAVEVEPPPPLFVNVGYSWTPAPEEEAEQWSQDNFSETIAVPEGYAPQWAKVSWSADVKENQSFFPPRPNAPATNFNIAFAVGGVSGGPEVTYDQPTFVGVVLQLSGNEWPQGVPVSGRVHGHWDKTLYVQVTLTCIRTENALNRWRLRTWEALRVGFETLERKLAQEEDRRVFENGAMGVTFSGRASARNREIERTELQKWAIKSMRLVPQNFNAVEQVTGEPEPSPFHAELQAPIVRFFENSFEWEQMAYFFYPYHWARRESWRMRMALEDVDPQFRAFLEAGAARVIVPVTPGYEDKVKAYIDPESTGDELTRILSGPTQTQPSATNPYRDVWIELMIDRKADVARGSGTLSVINGVAEVTINADSLWVATDQDVGREIHIAGDRYVIVSRINDKKVRLDRAFEGQDEEAALYAAGSVPFGPAWKVNIPTTLVVLADNVPALQNV
jgi:hypothetical protein